MESKDSIILYGSPPFRGESIEQLSLKIKEKLSGRAKSVFLFGSAATGHLSPSSDLDLIIVAETQKPFTQRAEDFFDLYDITCPLDILVYTPAEFESLTHEPSVGFWTSVTRDLRRIV